MSENPLGSKHVMQVAVVVHDIEEKSAAWADLLDVPVPPVIETGPLEETHTEYKGGPTEARAKLAFFDLGQVALELIQPIGGPSTWKDQLDQHGESIHHIAFTINGMQASLNALDAKGMPLIQKGEYTGGRYAYVDSESRLGLVLELLEND